MVPIFKLILFAWLFSIANFSISAKWNTLYSLQTSNLKEVTTLSYTVNGNTPVFRVTLECNDSSVDNLLLVALRQRNSVTGLHVPRIINNYQFDRVSRTLCPLNHIVGTEPFTIEVSSYQALKYTVRADLVTDFEIKTNETRLVSASASQPVFYHYRFPEHIDTVLVNMQSNSTTCMTLSIQEAQCLVFDLQSNVRYEGLYATMTTNGSVRVAKSSFKEFYIVLVINENDDLCEDWYNIKPMKPISLPVLEKTFNLTIEEKLGAGYAFSVVFVIVLNIILFSLGLLSIYVLTREFRRHPEGYQVLKEEAARAGEGAGAVEAGAAGEAQGGGVAERVGEAQAPAGEAQAPAGEAQAAAGEAQALAGEAQAAAGEAQAPAGKAQAFAGAAQAIARKAKTFAREALGNDPLNLENQWEQLNPRRNNPANENVQPNINARPVQPNIHDVYASIDGVLFLSVYYCFFATVQMLIREAKSNKDSGNFDGCVYNFDCAHSWWIFVSANSVFSNVSYIVLGFVLWASNFKNVERERGIYQHSGVKRAVGVAIASEGFFSAAYHVCPSRYNFQFDTINMYLICFLSIKQTWSNRHIVLFPISYSLFYCLLISTIAVIQMYALNVAVFIAFTLVHYLFLIILLVFFNSQGRDIRNFLPSRLTECLFQDFHQNRTPIPFSGVRLTFSFFAVIGNGFVFWKFGDGDLFTLELYSLIFTSALYQFYYFSMKLVYEEWTAHLLKSFVLLGLACVCWGFAIYYFFLNVSDWKVTPAHSRELNQKCMIMNFYDAHDFWHFLSAIALFLSALYLNTVDDNLADKPRAEIKIF